MSQSSTTTPTKQTAGGFSLATPEATDMAGAPPEEEMLLDTFSGMRLHPGAHKRTADVLTIEGSPVSVKYWSKRQDTQPTPRAKHHSFFHGISGHGHNNNTGPRRVLVLTAGSDDHDTGAHQENALRTSLLCGPDGCLRRKSLTDFILWADGTSSSDGYRHTTEFEGKPAAIADLLRVHEYAYLAHLENKCKGEGEMPYFYAPTGFLDADTPLVKKSLEASRKFCGYVTKTAQEMFRVCFVSSLD